MDKLTENRTVLRITALVLAVLLFISVRSEMGERDRFSMTEREDIIRDVPVEIYYDSDNMLVTGVPTAVNIRLKGPTQDILATQTSRDFKVFVDLDSLLIGKHKVRLQYENISNRIDVDIDPEYVEVVIEERVTREFKVEAELNSTAIADGYTLKGLEVNPTTVFITGAKSIIDSIGYVKATLADNDSKESYSREADVRVLDDDLNKLDVEVKPEKVKVNVDVGRYSREIQLELKAKGKVKDGLILKGIEAEQRMITVYGSKAIVDAIKTFEVEVDVSKFTESKTYTVPLTKPEGVSRLENDSIKVNVDIEKSDKPSDKE